MADSLTSLSQVLYLDLKTNFPLDARRKWRLRVAERFWTLDSEQKSRTSQTSPSNSSDFIAESDPFDELSRDTSEIGIVLRTDFTNDDAWQTFHSKLQDAEQTFATENNPEPDDDKMVQDGPEPLNQQTADEAEDSSSGEEEDSSPIFKVINASSPAHRAQFSQISNLTALRLLNDVSIRPAPVPPAGEKRIKPPNRLVDHDGWQEIYTGKTLWIYDARSNEDQCVRLVNQTSSDMYGTATGDSWRARVGHICELQVNLYSGAMKIDFGGLDRWDYSERQRNMLEATLPIT